MEPGSVPMDDLLALFLTWTTYGSWLSGDKRGWVEKPGQFMMHDPAREAEAAERMHESELVLDPEQRDLIERTIADHCEYRGWQLHAVKCQAQHVHVVVSAPQRHPDDVLDQFKAWCTRRLKELARAKLKIDAKGGMHQVRMKWWSEGGSKRRLFGTESLSAAIYYVMECQDLPR
jgi:REP element-mobilizing transposase RayT